jgi:hypothetical protein
VHQGSPKPSGNHQEPSGEALHVPTVKKTQAKKSEEVTLSEWLEAIKANGESAIPESDAVFAYAERVGLPTEFLALAWSEFKVRYTAEPMSGKKQKTYTDWRAVFRRAVRDGWLKLWYLNGDSYALTTAGVQAQRAQEVPV